MGADLLKRTHVDVDAMKETAVRDALNAAEKRHTRELRAALRRLRQEADDERRRQLDSQKQVTRVKKIFINYTHLHDLPYRVVLNDNGHNIISSNRI